MNKNTKDFEKLIGIKFNKLELLNQALIHKSFNSDKNNEKLEFLGDRVLGLVIAKKLIETYPKEKEGIIDKKYANLVNKNTCLKIAKTIDLKKYMYLGDSYKGIKTSNNKIISDCLEALIGAIYLDSGIKSAEKFIFIFWKDYIIKSEYTLIDPKTKLQEYSLKKYKELPKYSLHKESGPKHNPLFKIEVKIPHSKIFIASGNSKKKAQQNAAKKLLDNLKIL